jgi:hypothetical protein
MEGKVEKISYTFNKLFLSKFERNKLFLSDFGHRDRVGLHGLLA